MGWLWWLFGMFTLSVVARLLVLRLRTARATKRAYSLLERVVKTCDMPENRLERTVWVDRMNRSDLPLERVVLIANEFGHAIKDVLVVLGDFTSPDNRPDNTELQSATKATIHAILLCAVMVGSIREVHLRKPWNFETPEPQPLSVSGSLDELMSAIRLATRKAILSIKGTVNATGPQQMIDALQALQLNLARCAQLLDACLRRRVRGEHS